MSISTVGQKIKKSEIINHNVCLRKIKVGNRTIQFKKHNSEKPGCKKER